MIRRWEKFRIWYLAPKVNHMLLPSPAQIFDIGGDQKDLKLDQILPMDNQKWYLLSRTIFTLRRWSLSLERTDFLRVVKKSKSFHSWLWLPINPRTTYHFCSWLPTACCNKEYRQEKKVFWTMLKFTFLTRLKRPWLGQLIGLHVTETI